MLSFQTLFMLLQAIVVAALFATVVGAVVQVVMVINHYTTADKAALSRDWAGSKYKFV